jgi:hypothetical protein
MERTYLSITLKDKSQQMLSRIKFNLLSFLGGLQSELINEFNCARNMSNVSNMK